MRERIRKKLRSRAGESITETLVSLLISAAALVMLAGAMASSSGIILRSRDKLDDYYDSQETVIQQTSGTVADDGVTLAADDGELADGTYRITYYVNDEFGDTPVVTYKKSN